MWQKQGWSSSFQHHQGFAVLSWSFPQMEEKTRRCDISNLQNLYSSCCCCWLWFTGLTPLFELFTGLTSRHLTACKYPAHWWSTECEYNKIFCWWCMWLYEGEFVSHIFPPILTNFNIRRILDIHFWQDVFITKCIFLYIWWLQMLRTIRVRFPPFVRA